MKIFVSHSSNFDYENELYKPLEKLGYDFVFPHRGEVIDTKK